MFMVINEVQKLIGLGVLQKERERDEVERGGS